MPFRKLALLAVSITTVILAPTTLAHADSFSALVVYGDSLSDNGNLYNATKAVLGTGIPTSPPYYMGRYYSLGPAAFAMRV